MIDLRRAVEDCDHPDDMRGPLPYAGQPPRGDEWECLLCGKWEAAVSRYEDIIPTVRRVGETMVTLNLQAGAFKGSVEDVYSKLRSFPRRDDWRDRVAVMPAVTAVDLASPGSVDTTFVTFRDVAIKLGGAFDYREVQRQWSERTLVIRLDTDPFSDRVRRDVIQLARDAARAARSEFEVVELGLVARIDGRLHPMASFEELHYLAGQPAGAEWMISRQTMSALMRGSGSDPRDMVHVFGSPVVVARPPDHVPDGCVALVQEIR